jgi:hypothetical protein
MDTPPRSSHRITDRSVFNYDILGREEVLRSSTALTGPHALGAVVTKLEKVSRDQEKTANLGAIQ